MVHIFCFRPAGRGLEAIPLAAAPAGRWFEALPLATKPRLSLERAHLCRFDTTQQTTIRLSISNTGAQMRHQGGPPHWGGPGGTPPRGGSMYMCVCVCVCIYVRMYVCVCVCMMHTRKGI